MTKEERIAELDSLSWQAIKAAATAVGIEEKPDDKSWDDMIPEIVDLEFSSTTEVDTQESVIPDSDDSSFVEPVSDQAYTPKNKYPTAFYQSIGISTCSKCGDKPLADERGPICSENLLADCPRIP